MESSSRFIFIDVEWRHLAISLGRDAHLSLQKVIDGACAMLVFFPNATFPCRIGLIVVDLIHQHILPLLPFVLCAEMLHEDFPHVSRLHIGITYHLSIGQCYIDERHLIAGTHTTHGFDAHVKT